MIYTKSKYLIAFISLVIVSSNSLLKAQDLLGISTGNYAGIASVSQNPASIVDSRLKFDINIFGISSSFNNNYLSIKKDALIRGSFFKSPYNSSFDAVRADLLVENKLAVGEKAYAHVKTRVQMPLSFMATIGKKSAIALNIESRTGIQMDNISQDLAKMSYENFKYQPYYGQAFNADGLSINALSWISAGLTYGSVLFNTGNHFVKGAFTAKYIGGVASMYNTYDNLNYTFVDSGNLVLNSATAKYGHSQRTDFDKFKNIADFKPEADGFGLDAGLVYEYRGKIKNFLYNDATTEDMKARRDMNKYSFRLSAALVDFGKINFKKAEFSRDFTAQSPLSFFNFEQINASSISDIDTAIAQRVIYNESDGSSYDVALPTALNINFDLHLFKGFYINAGTFQPIKLDKNAPSRIDAAANFSVTPRWESRVFGLYVPLTYNTYKDFQLGTTVRIGPLYVGSTNLATVLFKDKVKNADIHLGLRVPIAYGKPSKLSKLLNKTFDKLSDDTDIKTTMVRASSTDTTITVSKATLAPAPVQPITIIINNYNSGTPPQQQVITTVDTITQYRTVPSTSQKPIIINSGSVVNGYSDSVLQKRSAIVTIDSTMQLQSTEIKALSVVTDSISVRQAEIDYLINKMAAQELKIKQLEAEVKKKSSKESIKSTPVTDTKAMERELQNIKNELAAVRREYKNTGTAKVYNTYPQSAPVTQQVTPATVTVHPIINQPASVAPVIITDTVSVIVRDTTVNTITKKDTVFIQVPAVKDTIYLQKAPEKIVVNTTTDNTVDGLLTMQLEKVLFAVGKFSIKPVHFTNLDFIATQLKKYTELKVQLNGYTDAQGDKNKNIELSKKRSNAVKAYLLSKGVVEEKITINYHGAEMPVADNKTNVGKLLNRRVELSFIR